MNQFTSFEKTLENIEQLLQYLIQMQEFSILQESGFYNPDVMLGDALQGVREALACYLEMQTAIAKTTTLLT